MEKLTIAPTAPNLLVWISLLSASSTSTESQSTPLTSVWLILSMHHFFPLLICYRGPNARYTEPYRLYNFDVFEYELNSPMALYGHVPFLMGHSQNQTAALFWLNSAETWVDVEKRSGSGIVDVSKVEKFVLKQFQGLLSSFFGGNKEIVKTVDTHWMSESGIIGKLLKGTDSNSTLRCLLLRRTYSKGCLQTILFPRRKTGTATYLLHRIPSSMSHYALVIHLPQCRWNYQDEDDVRTVNGKFEEHDIPYDVIWLDIEHTDGKRYFTWDPKTFPNPENMINDIASYGRKMVTIIDPHIKRDDGYHIHQSATSLGHYVKVRTICFIY